MSQKKGRVSDIDYQQTILDFLKSGKSAFVPDEQRTSERAKWHQGAEKFGLISKTVKVWKLIRLCGRHKKPIIGMKPSTDPYSQCYDSDYECDYQCNPTGDSDSDEDCISNCCYSDKTVKSKLRTVVIFNKSEGEKIKGWNINKIKDHLVTLGLVTHNGPQDQYKLN